MLFYLIYFLLTVCLNVVTPEGRPTPFEINTDFGKETTPHNE